MEEIFITAVLNLRLLRWVIILIGLALIGILCLLTYLRCKLR